MQQLPARAGKFIRQCIVAPPGYCMISADYSGQEVRILAAYSRDDALQKAYNPCYKCEHNKDPDWLSQKGVCSHEEIGTDTRCSALDIHSSVTKSFYGDEIDVPISQINSHPVHSAKRGLMKGITFGLAYGMGEYGLAARFNIPLEEASKIIKQYFDTFPALSKYISDCQRYVDAYGEIADMVGRRRRFKRAGYNDPNKFETYYEDYFFRDGLRGLKRGIGKGVRSDRRAGTNFPIQGLAASMTKIAAVEVDRAFRENAMDAKIVEFIHDELLIICRRNVEDVNKTVEVVKHCMVDCLNMHERCLPNHPLGWSWPKHLPMEVSLDVGDSYGDLMSYDDFIQKLLSGAEVTSKLAAADRLHEDIKDDE